MPIAPAAPARLGVAVKAGSHGCCSSTSERALEDRESRHGDQYSRSVRRGRGVRWSRACTGIVGHRWMMYIALTSDGERLAGYVVDGTPKENPRLLLARPGADLGRKPRAPLAEGRAPRRGDARGRFRPRASSRSTASPTPLRRSSPAATRASTAPPRESPSSAARSRRAGSCSPTAASAAARSSTRSFSTGRRPCRCSTPPRPASSCRGGDAAGEPDHEPGPALAPRGGRRPSAPRSSGRGWQRRGRGPARERSLSCGGGRKATRLVGRRARAPGTAAPRRGVVAPQLLPPEHCATPRRPTRRTTQRLSPFTSMRARSTRRHRLPQRTKSRSRLGSRISLRRPPVRVRQLHPRNSNRERSASRGPKGG